ncbi:MAG: putative endonuclease lcl3 [Caeruleum heppii]|nr:MAG: putative endonuclease lcl3 [Caeruleum heppii]
MRWPPWSSEPTSNEGQDDKKRSVSWGDTLNATNWSHYTDPRTVVPTILLTTTTLVLVHVYRAYLRRIPDAATIQPTFFRKRSLFGRVTSVGDGDNFRLFHTPGGRLSGWGWLPGRRVPEKREDLKARTIHVRLAGVDAPELAHFGRPSQPYSTEALEWLRTYILHRQVRAYVYKRDQYDRVVSTVYVRRWLFRRDVGLQMLKQGLATVYEAKSGAEFGKLEDRYRRAEWWAKRRRKGMWGGKKSDFESPRDYKTRMGAAEEKVPGK